MELSEEEIIFRIFADAHPHETYAAEPERFWNYFQEEYPGVSRDVMERLLEESAQPA